MTKAEYRKRNGKAKKLELLAMQKRNALSDIKREMLQAVFDQNQIEAELELHNRIELMDSFDAGPMLTERQKHELGKMVKYIAAQVFNELLHHIQGTTFGRFE